MWFSLNYPPHHEYLTLPPISSSSSSSGTKRLNGWTGKSPTQVLTHHNQGTKDKWVRLWPGQGVWTLHIALSTLSTINNPFFHYYNRSSFLCFAEEGGDKKVNSACYAGSFVTWPDTTSDTAGALIRTRKCVVWLLVYLIMMINIPSWTNPGHDPSWNCAGGCFLFLLFTIMSDHSSPPHSTALLTPQFW